MASCSAAVTHNLYMILTNYHKQYDYHTSFSERVWHASIMPYLSDATMDDMQTVLRLIEKFIPSSYKLSLNIDRLKRTFDGIVTIVGKSKLGTNEISLHSKDLDIESVIVNGKSASFSFSNNDTLNIELVDQFINEYIVVVKYHGKISDSMHGMYPCYFEHDGKNKELIATQFESHHAREVFPCIDEPEAKATFDVTLTTETGVEVIGNMPISNQNTENGNLVTTFETTPIMSSYLLAWVVGELHKKTAQTKSGVEVNVWATPTQPVNSLDFALDIAVRSIEFFDKYFGVPYPLSKCDHVALPDFSSGAMENWGLITYREIALLADPDSSSISSKHYIATVIAHELSHQWFGNLVTMKWWNDLWLNESFASLVEYTAVNALEPDWNVWLDFASFESILALSRDSLAGVQPVQVEVNHPDEISTLFDGAIVYAKGARLLKMLCHYIGEEAFRSGLHNYFKEFAYKNTETADLWRALSDSSGKQIGPFMQTWISQPGYPVLHVTRDGNEVNLRQERLTSKESEPSDSLWPITLNSNYSEMPQIFDRRSIDIHVTENVPMRFNIGNDAHFITHYDDGLLLQILDLIKSDQLEPVDRLQFLNEQNLLANAGIISSATLVSILDAFSNETSEPVWDIISMTIGGLKKFVDDDEPAELALRQLAKRLASKQFERLGWSPTDNETETDTKLRSTIIGLMIYSEDTDILNHIFDIFESTEIDVLYSELRSLILSTIVRHRGSDAIIDKLMDKYISTTSSELKQDICSGLTSTRDAKVVERLLNTVKDTSIIRTQDTARWIAYLVRNKFGRELTWKWVQDNWDWINETFGQDKSCDDYPRYVATSLRTRQQLQEYRDFFEPLMSDPALTRVIKIGINEITDRVDSIERDSDTVKQALLNL